MKRIFSSLVLICLLLPSWLMAQEVEVKKERIFPATAMYGYMNGGTDQFLEYDVQKLTVIDLVYLGEEYTVELYDMPTPEDAFGIYALHVFKCNRTDAFNGINCLSAYQLQAAVGNTYISIVFPSGSDAARTHADDILQKYAPNSNQKISFIPLLLGTDIPVSGNLKYPRGTLSLTKTNTALAGLLKDIPYSGIWYSSDKPAKTYQALIYLANRSAADTLKSIIQPNDILGEDENYIYLKGDEKKESKEDTNDFGF